MTFGECYYKVKDYCKYIEYKKILREKCDGADEIEIRFSNTGSDEILCRMRFTQSPEFLKYVEVTGEWFCLRYIGNDCWGEFPLKSCNEYDIASAIFNPNISWNVGVKKYKKVEVKE